jgi:hypothetical protein
VHHVIQVDGALEEGRDRSLLRPRERLDVCELVDEQSVALVGGDATGAGVRLGDEPLLFESRHVVAHGRGRHSQPVAINKRLGADRLAGLHVVLDDGAEYVELAGIEHLFASSSYCLVGHCLARTRFLRVPAGADHRCDAWHSYPRSANSTSPSSR